MSELRAGNAVIGQSGGPTMVINQSLVGVIQEAQKHKHIKRLLGARHGVRGISNGNFIDIMSDRLIYILSLWERIEVRLHLSFRLLVSLEYLFFCTQQ